MFRRGGARTALINNRVPLRGRGLREAPLHHINAARLASNLTRKFRTQYAIIPLQCIPEVLIMPSYEYACKACKKTFILILTVAVHDKKRVACPKCKSKKVEQQFGSFFAVTSKKS